MAKANSAVPAQRGTTKLTPLDVETRGRSAQATRWRVALATAALISAALIITEALSATVSEPVVIGLLIVVSYLTGAALVRALAARFLKQVDGESSPRGSDPSSQEPSGTVITCSGGGIKSASFCLGALHALAASGTYGRAKHLIGVSGGGYAAAAFTTVAAAGTERPFASMSTEVSTLRRRTNYLASSSRVRFEFFASLLLGIALTVIIFGAAAGLWIWVLARHVRVIVESRNWAVDKSWGYGDPAAWGWLAAPAALVILSVVVFLYSRARADDPTWTRGISSRADKSWRADTPNLLAGWCVAWLVAVPGLAALAITMHNVWLEHGSLIGLGVSQLQALVGGASFAVVVALVRSAIKGLRVTSDTTSFSGALLRTFRQWVAPRLALAVMAVLAALTVATLLAFELTSTDQGASQRWFTVDGSLLPAIAGVVLVVTTVLFTANSTSMHVFYRERLAHAYLSHGVGGSATAYSLSLSGLPTTPAPENTSHAKPSVASAQHESASSDAGTTTPPKTRTQLEATGGVEAVDAGADSHDDEGMEVSSSVGVPTESSKVTPKRDAPKIPKSRFPPLTLCALANVQDDELAPTGRFGVPFVFSDSRIGLSDEGFSAECAQPQVSYMKRAGITVTLAQAVATSGAAVAPLAGRESRMRPYRVLLALANVRLGVWLPNPCWNEHEREWTGWRRLVMMLDERMNRPSGMGILAETFSTVSVFAPWLYVTDGGHYDNLGLVEALRGRPARVIVLDGSGDAEDAFPTMGRAIATARMDLGIEIDFDPTPMVRGMRAHPRSAWVTATGRYLDGTKVVINYVKCVEPEGLTWDLASYASSHPGFPATSSSLEMYDEFDFEAYRALGQELVQRAGF